MRLINAATLELERFDDDTKIPMYAILSHTWGAEEVSLQQLQDTYTGDEATCERVRQMSGYAKIIKACKQTLDDGYAYTWVDTCCIDKTSSAELSEAINSMFRWYQKAQVCFAFLEDFTMKHLPFGRTGAEVAGKMIELEEDLARARWFSRGWTLQELIAPRHVRFYDAGWNFFGTRNDSVCPLERVTGIDRRILNGGLQVKMFSIARRMSWASERITTRTEDTAYCLMGLFDVNMPLIYGEGEKAFTRLQEEIMKESDDQSLFAWSPIKKDLSWIIHDVRMRTGISVFAQCPKNFSLAKDIYPQKPGGHPSSVTNKGVKIDLPILQLDWTNHSMVDYFLAVLYCGHTRNERQHPAIVLQRLATETEPNTYARHYEAGIFMVNHDEVQSSDVRQVYLRKRREVGIRERL